MPSLIQVHSPIYLSHTDPPFLYQYVGDQVKIIQVLGKYPLSNSNDRTKNLSDIRDQKETTKEAPIIKNEVREPSLVDISKNYSESLTTTKNMIIDDSTNKSDPTSKNETFVDESTNINNGNVNKIDQDFIFGIKIQTTNEIENLTEKESGFLDGYDAESDDDASFGTPENTPREKRKSSKGKYGKAKAPAPPKTNNCDTTNDHLTLTVSESLSHQICFIDDVINPPAQETQVSPESQNSLEEKRHRDKSKSPVRLPISSNSSIAKLLQLPNKFAFWTRSDDKAKSDSVSISSGEHSRRSSTGALVIDDFQSCNDLSIDTEKKQTDATEIPQIKITDNDCGDNTTQNILDKSNALKKVIEAKIESHPEYKYISLHDELPNSSKSTDV